MTSTESHLKTEPDPGRRTMPILLSAPAAVDYHPRIGMSRHDSCWITPGRFEKGPPS